MSGRPPALVVFAGLPGAGKSTLALRVGGALRAPVLAVDHVDRVLAAHDIKEDPARSGLAAYGVVEALAEAQLGLGLTVIIDAVNPVEPARAQWRGLSGRTGARLHFVEVVCTDEAEHRRRVEERRTGDGSLPDWDQVRQRAEEYQPFTDERFVVDTAGEPAEAMRAVIAHLAGAA